MSPVRNERKHPEKSLKASLNQRGIPKEIPKRILRIISDRMLEGVLGEIYIEFPGEIFKRIQGGTLKNFLNESCEQSFEKPGTNQ